MDHCPIRAIPTEPLKVNPAAGIEHDALGDQ